MVIIRADGNGTIGMGHVMRCLSIADALRMREEDVLFVTACQECVSVVQERGYETICLMSDYRRMEDELEALMKLIQERHADVVLVDSYQITSAYMEALSDVVILAYMDDMGNSYPADIIINYNLYGTKFKYLELLEHRQLRCLQGTDYVPLRKEFTQDMAYELKANVKDVLITTGGGDPCFAAKAFVDAFLEQPLLQECQITYHVVSGPFNTFAQELKQAYQGYKQVVIHEHVTDMKYLMQSCDVVLTAAGSTVYEVSALGVPMICFYFVENQRQIAEEIGKLTSVINCGNFAAQKEEVCNKAVQALLHCVKEEMYRKQLYAEERKLVDGQGAMRIANALIEIQR